MNKKLTSTALAALMIAGTTSFSAFAAMADGTVVIGTKAFDLTYANDPAHATEIADAVVAGGTVYVKDFNGNWLDNVSGLAINASVIPAVTYKNAAGVITSFNAADTDVAAGVSVASVSAITKTSVSIDFTALTKAMTDITVMVKDNNGNIIAVNPQSFQIGETGATYTFVTPQTTAPAGIWIVGGVSFNNDAVTQLAAINTAVTATNQVTTLAALKAAGLTNIIDANIVAYMTSLTATPPTTLVEAQTAITAVNKSVIDGTDSATVVKAVQASTNQVTLLAALKNPALVRVNADWITAYAAVGAFDVTDQTTPSALLNLTDLASVQTIIDNVDAAQMPSVGSLTTVALANAKVALQQAYIIADIAPAHAKADAIKLTQKSAAVLAVKEATTSATVYNALVALTALDTTLPLTNLNANLKSQYLAAQVIYKASITSSTVGTDLQTGILNAADLSALGTATTTISALTTTSTTVQITAALQTLANVTSHLGTAKFDMSTVKTASLMDYVTVAGGFDATAVATVANVNTVITAVNNAANQAVFLNTIKTSKSVTDVRDALTGIALVPANASTSTSAYINASSIFKLEISQLIIDNQANLATTLTPGSITNVVSSGTPTYALNAIEKAITDQATKVGQFNAIGNLAAAGSPSITKTKAALDLFAYAPYVALTDSQKLAVAENINALTKPTSVTVATLIPLDFTAATGADRVSTIAQANAIIQAAIK